jgi:2-succinyl-5-enolpyruvyl-6-hydroxy-3-cyclohexene-1-carboxylate synthase
VHLNLAFDEPLSAADSEGAALAALAAAEPAAVWGRPDGAPWAPATAAGPAVLPPDEMQRLAERLRGGRGLVVAGPLGADEISPPSVLAFARACGAPLLADALSGLRGARLAGVPPRPAPSSPGLPSKEPSPILSAADLFLRDASLAQALRPDWILRLGRTPTSKAVQRWMAQHGEAPQFVVDSRGRREDPEHLGVRFLRAEPAPLLLGLARALAESPDPGGAWAASWQAAESAARAEVEAAVADGTAPPEAVLVRELADRLPAAARMLAASSMPVRELESFLAPASPARGCPDIAANRGLNGIDGLVSTLFGMAAARGPGAPVVGLLGDLAMLHDLGGLAAAPRLGLAPSFVVLNNGGGAIFEHLPVAATGAPMAELFVAEHSLAFEGAARMFGLDYRVSDEPREIALAASAPSSGRARLLELRVDRARSREAHQLLWRRASQASAAAARNVHPNPSTRCGGGSIGTCA